MSPCQTWMPNYAWKCVAKFAHICKASGLTAVYVTHDQKEALSIADRMVVLNNGHIQQLGTPQQVYRQPPQPFLWLNLWVRAILSTAKLWRSKMIVPW